MAQSVDLLTIQKFISLLDNFHFNEFRKHLGDINAALPLKLVETVRKKLPLFDSHEELCKKVYNNTGKTEKQNFNQLSSYTFKLSADLANNYPEYLQTNIQKIQLLVADGNLDEANFLNQALLDIADRTNDFPSQIFALRFMSQQSQMAKDTLRTQKCDKRLKEAVENQSLFYKIQSEFRLAVDTAVTPKTENEVKELQKYFDGFIDHPCNSIRILSQFVGLNIICDLTSQKLTESDKARIKKIQKDIDNHPYVVFPFLLDIKGSLQHMVLNSAFTNVFSKEAEKDYKQLSAHYNSIKFWKNYINMGELHLITVQSTKLLSKYHYQVHLSNYQKIVTPEDAHLMVDLIGKCRAIIAKLEQGNGSSFEEISVRMLYSALMILSGGKQIAEGVAELESLLINYQQVNFKRSTSSIFLCLMVGYFSLRDYKKCNLTYKRYLKSVKGKLFFEGNNVKIQSYYYISQWLDTRSKQYAAKLEAVLEADGNNGAQRTIWQLINHFELPIEAPEGMVTDLV